MDYKKLTIIDGVTVIDKELLDAMQEGIIEGITKAEENAGSGTGGGSPIELDKTLTQEGKAADAKAVGDAIGELPTEFKTINGQTILGTGNLTIEAEADSALRNEIYGDPEPNDPYFLPEVGTVTPPVGTPEIVISNKNVSFTESTNLVLQVSLNTTPTASVTVNFTSEAITCNPSSMTFTTENWNKSQSLTISYTKGDIQENLSSSVSVSAVGGDYEGKNETISVTVIAEGSQGGDDDDDDVESPDSLSMRSAQASDFTTLSAYMSGINIGGDGVVTGAGSAQYPALFVGGTGNKSAIEWEAGNEQGLWVLGGKTSQEPDSNYIGFGDASMTTIQYWAKFIEGGCTPTSGVNATVSEAIPLGTGKKFHLNRIGTLVSLYEMENEKWELKFQIDLATCGHFDAGDYAVNAVGVLFAGQYMTIKNVKVLGE